MTPSQQRALSRVDGVEVRRAARPSRGGQGLEELGAAVARHVAGSSLQLLDTVLAVDNFLAEELV